MELKKAIERLKNTDIYNLGHNDRFEELRLYEIAIDTVLEELNNRIPTEAIEKKIQEYKGLKEIDMQAYEEQIKPLKELLNKE
jgi:hypothetical protein